MPRDVRFKLPSCDDVAFKDVNILHDNTRETAPDIINKTNISFRTHTTTGDVFSVCVALKRTLMLHSRHVGVHADAVHLNIRVVVLNPQL